MSVQQEPHWAPWHHTEDLGTPFGSWGVVRAAILVGSAAIEVDRAAMTTRLEERAAVSGDQWGSRGGNSTFGQAMNCTSPRTRKEVAASSAPLTNWWGQSERGWGECTAVSHGMVRKLNLSPG